jgi:hypothetical protein
MRMEVMMQNESYRSGFSYVFIPLHPRGRSRYINAGWNNANLRHPSPPDLPLDSSNDLRTDMNNMFLLLEWHSRKYGKKLRIRNDSHQCSIVTSGDSAFKTPLRAPPGQLAAQFYPHFRVILHLCPHVLFKGHLNLDVSVLVIPL